MTESPKPFRPAGRGAPLEKRLAAFPFFDGLDPESFRRLLGATQAVHFDRDTTLVEPHADVEVVPLVERGVIRVQRTDESGRTISLYEVRAGESCVLALAGALRGGRYPAEALALEDSDALFVETDALREVFAQAEHLQQFVLDLYSARFIDMMQLVREVAFDRLDVRLARLLLSLADAGPGLWKPIELSHGELAGRLGSSREVVSRTLGRLRRDGLVEVERTRTVLVDPEALAARFGLTI